jgi:mannose-6-phosphate isomerase-like protein (cupin superfamily)
MDFYFAPLRGTSVNAGKTFEVFGEPVEVLVSGEITGGLSTTLTQTSPPGGGPPPHSHAHEDETFFVLEGDYEMLQNGVCHKISPGQAVLGRRGGVHIFRNAGTITGECVSPRSTQSQIVLRQ